MVINFKQRILGIVILVAIAAIFLPMLFSSSGSKHFKTKLSSGIPTPPTKPEVKYQRPPEVKTVVLPQPTSQTKPKQETVKLPAKTVTNASIPQANKPVAANPLNNTIESANPQKSVAKPAIVKKSAKAITSGKTVPKTQAAKPKTSVKKATRTAAEMPLAWVVQVGSFSDKANVKRLVEKLRQQDLIAFTETVKTAKGSIIKVLIGPELQRAAADKIQATLYQKLKLKGFVSRYHVKA